MPDVEAESPPEYFDPEEAGYEAVQPEPEQAPDRPPCLCGCGAYPVGAKAKYLPGHYGKTQKGVSRPRVSKAGRRKAAREAGAEKPRDVDRSVKLMEWFQGLGQGLGLAGQQLESAPMVADAILIYGAAAPVSTALVELADDNAVIDRVVTAMVASGPYAALTTALAPLVMQMAANHGLLKPNPMFGILSPEDVIAAASAGGGESGG